MMSRLIMVIIKLLTFVTLSYPELKPFPLAQVKHLKIRVSGLFTELNI